MIKPIRFELEFSGWQGAKIDEDGALMRPARADEIAQAVADDLNHRFAEMHGRGKLKVKVRRLQ